MRVPSQLPLSFDHRPALSGEDFLVAPPNADAVAWIDSWPDWPYPALVVFGPPGCGKTHLAQVFMARSGARPITPQQLRDLEPPRLIGEAPALVLEDAEAFLGQQRALLHLYNVVQETDRRMLLTAAAPPARWKVTLADLSSRLNAAPVAAIGPPDDALMAAVLVKLFADRQLDVDAGVVGFMVARMERSFAAARRLVAAVDASALAQHRKITVPLVGQVMQGEAAER